MVKTFCICLLFASFCTVANAQPKAVNGFLRDSITLFPIKGAMITNGVTGKTVETNPQGFFHLDASLNDRIYAVAKNFHYDTLTFSYLFTDTISILLSPAGNILPNVVVRGKMTRYQLDSLERKLEFEQANGQQMKTLSTEHPSGFGVTINLDRLFKKKFRDRNAAQKIFNESEKRAYVEYRFSPHLVNFYTSLRGDALQSFINKYTPTFEWLRDHPTNEDVLYYINDKLKSRKLKTAIK